ncbi:large subunit ribosomal protein L31e [Clonorchis sinensis]|uniref:Large subunit ribosomal protein L31e n=1 Tax=Clonorchis sinensis TaxID=79923 RepID=G7Y7E6_CLOSI|nr:large subunit ribosomal protein L31e [Clonorchis sinensis]
MVQAGGKTRRTTRKGVATREYTIHIHKRIHGVGFKRRAPRAIKEIKKFAKKMMGTEDVRIGVRLNECPKRSLPCSSAASPKSERG